MFDIGWTELLLIGIVALIVVGPKDLPIMFRTLGRFTAKIRAMGREFSRAMEQAADESGVKDVARDIKAATNLRQSGIDALKEAATKFESWDPKRTSPGAGAAASAAPAKAAGPAAEGKAVAAPDASRGPNTAALTAAQEAGRAERLAAVSKPVAEAPATAAPGRSADA
ncbi:MAG: Sec-independent protein translocase protein TatB [Gemmobacter sp.]